MAKTVSKIWQVLNLIEYRRTVGCGVVDGLRGIKECLLRFQHLGGANDLAVIDPVKEDHFIYELILRQ